MEDVSDRRREELLKWVRREGATVGHRIPETVTVDDEELALKEFVWETKRQGAVPPKYREEVQRVRATLVAERDRREERLAEGSITTAEAERLADSIVGLDRAIAALQNLYENDFAEDAQQASVDDHKRWLAFVDQL